MDEEIRRRLIRIEESHSEGRTEIDELARAVTRLAKVLNADSDGREAAAAKLSKKVDEIHEQYEAILAALRTLPDDTVRAVEKIVYQLRIARHEALLAGVSNEPPPLLPAPGRRDPTGSFAPAGGDTGRVPRIDPEEQEGADAEAKVKVGPVTVRERVLGAVVKSLPILVAGILIGFALLGLALWKSGARFQVVDRPPAVSVVPGIEVPKLERPHLP
jgi:hypothetical protein